MRNSSRRAPTRRRSKCNPKLDEFCKVNIVKVYAHDNNRKDRVVNIIGNDLNSTRRLARYQRDDFDMVATSPISATSKTASAKPMISITSATAASAAWANFSRPSSASA
jgi:hypothetical protein